MAPVVLEGLRRLSENIKKREGETGDFPFLYTIGNVDFFLRFSPLMFLRKSKNKERQNKRAKGIKRQDRLGQLEINI